MSGHANNLRIKFGDDGLPVGRKKLNYRTENGVLQKRCSHCGKFYRLNYFYSLKYQRNGIEHETLQSWCKFCMIEDNCKRVLQKKNQQINEKV